MKYVYKVLLLVAVFVASVWFMGQNMQEERFALNKKVEMSEATFPVVEILSGESRINLLHGYSGTIDVNSFRESVVPIGMDQSVTMEITENETTIKRVDYEVLDVGSDKVLDSGTISALDTTGDKKTAKLLLKAQLKEEKEYTLEMTCVTDTSKKIHYFTRIKLIDKAYVKEKLDFVTKFHQATFDANKKSEYAMYLEPRVTEENNSLARVNINSTSDLVWWNGMDVTVETELTPTLKEIGPDTAAIQLCYIIKAKSGPEQEKPKETPGATQPQETKLKATEQTYYVEEFYRIRYTSDRVYLLYFDRTMETLFDSASIDYTKGEIPLGIADKSDVDIESTPDNKKVCFVRNGNLWYYDIEANQITKVFTFEGNEKDYLREGYNKHNVRILNLDETGNIDFLVYGYMNRGDYEGRVGLVVYRYIAKDRRIQEQVYIPMQQPYEIVADKLDQFSYLSRQGIFYFSLNNTIYSYNIVTKDLNELVSNVTSSSFTLSKEGHFIAWQDAAKTKNSKKITIKNLEDETEKTIEAPEGESIKMLGNISGNLIYGYVRKGDIVSQNGTTVEPIYKLQIANVSGMAIMESEPKDSYISDIEIKDNVIGMKQIKKNAGNQYEEAAEDYIVNPITEKKEVIALSEGPLTATTNQWTIQLPEGTTIAKQPTVKTTMQTIITEDTTLHFPSYVEKEVKYYVYALGNFMDSYTNAAKAIQEADTRMGVVVDSKNHVVWERGGKESRSSIGSLTEQYASGGYTSVSACISMVLKYNQVSVDATKLAEKNGTIFDLLSKYLDTTPINLSGATLEQVLYLVSKKIPVIGMKNGKDAVVITGYDEYNITYIDPAARTTGKMGLNAASEMFKQAGNAFVSYVR